MHSLQSCGRVFKFDVNLQAVIPYRSDIQDVQLWQPPVKIALIARANFTREKFGLAAFDAKNPARKRHHGQETKMTFFLNMALRFVEVNGEAKHQKVKVMTSNSFRAFVSGGRRDECFHPQLPDTMRPRSPRSRSSRTQLLRACSGSGSITVSPWANPPGKLLHPARRRRS